MIKIAFFFFFFQAEDGIRDYKVTGVQTCALPIWMLLAFGSKREGFDDDVWFLRTGTPGGEAFQVRGVHALPLFSPDGKSLLYGRSEERRVGKECRSRWSPYH